jgi:hypothetical protein
MHRERLDHLVRILESVEAAKKLFDLTSWISDQTSETTLNAPPGKSGEACGTAACAFGYAALDPEFQQQGLHFEARRYECAADGKWIKQWQTVSGIEEFNRLQSLPETDFHFEPGYDGLLGFEAAEVFFGISRRAACFLFDPDYYEGAFDRPVSPSEVIARVQEVIALDGDAPADIEEVG